ncbi:MAG: hypothetical protein ACXWQQ_11910 [Pseudobdellovibrio sp.]
MNKLTLKSVFTPVFLLLFAAMFLSTLSDQVISNKIEALVSSKDGFNNMIWFWGGISLFTAIAFPMLTAMISSYNLVKTQLNGAQFIEENLELSVIENLRSWGKSFLWSFVFILPGIWKFIRYTLTPYVVLFSSRYKKGEVDALEYSSMICKKYWKQVNWWLTVFYLFVPIFIYFTTDNYRLLNEHPVAGTLIVLVHTLLEYLFHYKMLQIFIKFINENETFSLEAQPAR